VARLTELARARRLHGVDVHANVHAADALTNEYRIDVNVTNTRLDIALEALKRATFPHR